MLGIRIGHIFNALFERKFNLKLHLIFFPIFITIASMLIVPLKVTVDGRLYLSSARALFTDKMDTHYYWVREPFYPLLLRFIRELFGNSDLGLIFVQGSLLGSSIVFCLYAFSLLLNIKEINFIYIGLIYFFALNPFILGMTGLVLQQVIFTFYLSAITLVFSLTYINGFKLSYFSILLIIFFISILTSIAFLLLFIPFYLTFFVLVLFNSEIKNISKVKNVISFFKKLTLAVLGTATMYLSGFVTLRLWSIFKNSNSPKSSLPTELFTPEQINNTIVEATTSLSLLSLLVEQSQRYIKNFFSLFHFTESEAFPFYELTIYTNFQFNPGWICGAYDEFEEKPYSSFGFGYFAGNCRSEYLNSLIFPHLSFFDFLYTLIMIFIIAATLVFILTKKRFVFYALIPQYTLIFAYTLADAGLDRYGYSIIPIAFGLLMSINLVPTKKLHQTE